jgi:hypothetical protein
MDSKRMTCCTIDITRYSENHHKYSWEQHLLWIKLQTDHRNIGDPKIALGDFGEDFAIISF